MSTNTVFCTYGEKYTESPSVVAPLNMYLPDPAEAGKAMVLNTFVSGSNTPTWQEGHVD